MYMFLQCYRYNPVSNSWTEDAQLAEPRWGHTLQYIPDARAGPNSDSSEVPVLFGGNREECEVYSTSEQAWSDYGNALPEVCGLYY